MEPATSSRPSKLSTNVQRLTEPVYSPSHLLILDPNPLPSTNEEALQSAARDAAQSLISHLLTTCPISASGRDVTLSLTPPIPAVVSLPREKTLPLAKQKTPWELFAAKKGIKKKKRGETGEGGRANLVFDAEKQEWQPKWGYKGKNKERDSQWLVEVDDDDDRDDGGRQKSREERVKAIRRNERRAKANSVRRLHS